MDIKIRRQCTQKQETWVVTLTSNKIGIKVKSFWKEIKRNTLIIKGAFMSKITP